MKSLLTISVITVLGVFLLSGCTASVKNAFAIKTAEHGQCRGLAKDEGIRYKKKLVSYVCEDKHLLFGQPYQLEGEWYFKAARYEGKKLKETSASKVVKEIRSVCQFEGSYGTGKEHIRKFYFDNKLKACLPFDWSGKDGISPFDSVDVCEKSCYY